jgi:hypothetical protein
MEQGGRGAQTRLASPEPRLDVVCPALRLDDDDDIIRVPAAGSLGSTERPAMVMVAASTVTALWHTTEPAC